MRTGIVASTVVNVSPNRKRGAKPVTPKDFMPQQSRKMDMDPKRIREDFLSAFGPRVKRKEKPS